jgi:CDGSH-type Zn-finger protein/uncharacterized Fe-S cluster protein YjdI
MKERIIKYKGKHIIVRFGVDRCTHAAECIRGLPKVFDIKRIPWIDPDAALPDAVAEVVMRCPTGALHFERTDGGPPEPIPTENIVILNEDGPLYIRGNIQILSPDREVLIEDTRISLCRCGDSNDKPFCDGLHTVIDFKDAGKISVDQKKSSAEEPESGVLKIILQPDGPLLLSGPFKIRDADGKINFTGNRAALCRCRASRNKPFCDGSHIQSGFPSV